MNTSKNVNFNPVISSIQKVALYETNHKIYLLGSNFRETRFRILEIDRSSMEELRIYENPNELDSHEIRQFIAQKKFTKRISAYGVLGFVRFLESYYVILITKRTNCACIGMHNIYKINDTVMHRITNSANIQLHPNEARYVKIFCNIDLKSNFYFCYSYDLTRTLQHNMSGPKYVGQEADIEAEEPLPNWDQMNIPDGQKPIEYAFRSVSRQRFVWNSFLLKPLDHIVHRDWRLEIIHGFVSQSTINIFGRSIFINLIARRSTKFAGTRYLKRGANHAGDVANEVETEQIVTDGPRMCSFVQMRGSIPSHWSQDFSNMVPKPPISLDLSDPYAETSAKHFERLLFHYGSPIIVFNLVKKREKRKHESILTQDMLTNIRYLNQFVPTPFKIKYIHFDMARKNRGERSIMADLAKKAEMMIQQTGMYLHDPKSQDKPMYQTGLVRTNCVDCLDRTNTAQFAIGKCALAHQLQILGFLNPPALEFDSDCVTMLEALYEDHGDTLALQYGGSQLVHRIKTYRKTAAWTSQGNDIMQTLSRYYSNTFSDTEKQHSINLFLGYFIPYENISKENVAIWDLPSDYYMHLQSWEKQSDRAITDWIRPIIINHLPYPTSDCCKTVSQLFSVPSKNVETIDAYSSYHIPYKFTPFEELVLHCTSLQSRNFVKNQRADFSPFLPNKREQNVSKNPSLTGQSSTSSTANSSSDSLEEDSSTDEDQLNESLHLSSLRESQPKITFENVLSSMEDVYGFELTKPSRNSQQIYKNYVKIGKTAKGLEDAVTNLSSGRKPKRTEIVSKFKESNYDAIMVPSVSEEAKDIYSQYLSIPQKYKANTMEFNDDILKNYINVGINSIY